MKKFINIFLVLGIIILGVFFIVTKDKSAWPGPANPDLENLVTIYVTDTTDSGMEGSLRYAMEYPGPRRIVPKISGTIILTDDIEIVDSMMWYDGGIGPAPGLTVTGGSIRIEAHDIVIEYLHVRRENVQNGNDGPGLELLQGCEDVVISHCSISWGKNEALLMNTITFSNCVIFQGLSDKK